MNKSSQNDPERRLQQYLCGVFGLSGNANNGGNANCWGKTDSVRPKPWNASKKIAVLLSGGVDSSLALAALKRCGAKDVEAYYLKIWFDEADQFLGDCPWQEDLDYAAAVCEQLDVPLHVIPLQGEYYRYVVEYTLSQLRRARTPSPDIFCNREIKFGAFRECLRQRYKNGPTPLIASGHYALLQTVWRRTVVAARRGSAKRPKLLSGAAFAAPTARAVVPARLPRKNRSAHAGAALALECGRAQG